LQHPLHMSTPTTITEQTSSPTNDPMVKNDQPKSTLPLLPKSQRRRLCERATLTMKQDRIDEYFQYMDDAIRDFIEDAAFRLAYTANYKKIRGIKEDNIRRYLTRFQRADLDQMTKDLSNKTPLIMNQSFMRKHMRSALQPYVPSTYTNPKNQYFLIGKPGLYLLQHQLESTLIRDLHTTFVTMKYETSTE